MSTVRGIVRSALAGASALATFRVLRGGERRGLGVGESIRSTASILGGDVARVREAARGAVADGREAARTRQREVSEVIRTPRRKVSHDD